MTALKPCGTRAAYKRHLRRREVPCQPCVQANRAYVTTERALRLDKALAQGRRAVLAAAVYTTTRRRTP